MPASKRGSRSKPIAVIGGVSVLAPTEKYPYYRLTWINPDNTQGHTTATRYEDHAIAKAKSLAVLLANAPGPGGMQTLGAIVDAYLASPEGRNHKTGGNWTSTHHMQVARKLRRATRGYRDSTAMAVDRALVDLMRGQAGTRRTVAENTSAIRGLLRWGATEGYFSTAQGELLPPRASRVAPRLKGTPAPKRGLRARQVGESEVYIRDEDAPSLAQVRALRGQMRELVAWGALAVELAAATGLRWAEQFQLTAHDIHVDGDRVWIAVEWQIDPSARRRAGDNPRKLPKGEKTRKVGVLRRSFTGFEVRAELLARRDAALAEQAAKKNPQALLFPAAKGGLLHHTSFMSDFFGPAARAAGWPEQTWTEQRDELNKKTGRYERVERQRRQFSQPWHSLRHRFARVCVDQLGFTKGQLMAWGGWESEEVVSQRYYRSGAEHMESAWDKVDRYEASE